jgi:hypothetical protein
MKFAVHPKTILLKFDYIGAIKCDHRNNYIKQNFVGFKIVSSTTF